MKIALASARIADRDIQGNLLRMERYMRRARAAGAELVCFGEAFLQGFNALTWQYEQDREIARTDDSPELARVMALSREIGIDVLFGYNELADEAIYSACALIADGRLLHKYRRISVGWKEYWKTDAHYREGQSAECFDYRGRSCMIALCGDLWDFPEKFARGEELLFWPVYVSWTREEWENGGRLDYARQAALVGADTLYVNSLCEGDAFGGAMHLRGGAVCGELPIFEEGLLLVEA